MTSRLPVPSRRSVIAGLTATAALAATVPRAFGASPRLTPPPGTVVFDNTTTVTPSFTLTNWSDPSVRYFANVLRHRPLSEASEVVVHDTGGTSRSDAVTNMAANRSGVHFIVDRRGGITHHNELADVLRHDGRDSKSGIRSIGIEMVNPIRPANATSQWMQDNDATTLTVKFGQGGTSRSDFSYVIPSEAQCLAVYQIIGWLADEGSRRGLGVTAASAGADMLNHQGRTRAVFAVSELMGARWQHRPGVWAHHHVTDRKADGIFGALFFWLMQQLQGTSYANGLAAAKLASLAYREAQTVLCRPTFEVDRVLWVDVSDYTAGEWGKRLGVVTKSTSGDAPKLQEQQSDPDRPDQPPEQEERMDDMGTNWAEEQEEAEPGERWASEEGQEPGVEPEGSPPEEGAEPRGGDTGF